MENAVEALKMAFAVLVFVIALSICIFMFGKARETSDIVLSSSDQTQFYEYETYSNDYKTRIVGLETIIPTLYKYYKENYTVLFLDTSGKPLRLYSTQTNPELWSHDLDDDSDSIPDIISKYYDHENNEDVCAFDVDEETRRHEPWTGGPSDFKENLDAFLNGDVFVYPSENGEYDYGSSAQIGTGGFIGKYSNRKFEETLGEYTYNVESEDVDENNDTLLKNKEKRVIVYRLLP